MGAPGFQTWRRTFAAVVFLLWGPYPLHAQNIVDARKVEFLPSADDGTVTGSGVPVVDRYLMDIFLAGGTTSLQTIDLGKPQPDPDGYIRVDFIALLASPLTPGVVYEAEVSATGAFGTSAGSRSNSFAFSAPCSYSISPTSQAFAAAGGTGTVAVTAGSGCPWTARSDSTWLAITFGNSGTGGGTVAYTAAANTAASSRSGVLTIAGALFTVTEAASASACTFSISPTEDTMPRSGGTVTVAISADAGCAWTAVSPVAWITFSGSASGSGPGSVVLNVASNQGTSRSATVTIAGASFVLTERGKPR
jgi:hypothetical protein